MRICSATALIEAGVLESRGRPLLGLSLIEDISLNRLIVRYTNFFVIPSGCNRLNILTGVLLQLCTAKTPTRFSLTPHSMASTRVDSIK